MTDDQIKRLKALKRSLNKRKAPTILADCGNKEVDKMQCRVGQKNGPLLKVCNSGIMMPQEDALYIKMFSTLSEVRPMF